MDYTKLIKGGTTMGSVPSCSPLIAKQEGCADLGSSPFGFRSCALLSVRTVRRAIGFDYFRLQHEEQTASGLLPFAILHSLRPK